jgi:hypothetical protein
MSKIEGKHERIPRSQEGSDIGAAHMPVHWDIVVAHRAEANVEAGHMRYSEVGCMSSGLQTGVLVVAHIEVADIPANAAAEVMLKVWVVEEVQQIDSEVLLQDCRKDGIGMGAAEMTSVDWDRAPIVFGSGGTCASLRMPEMEGEKMKDGGREIDVW